MCILYQTEQIELEFQTTIIISLYRQLKMQQNGFPFNQKQHIFDFKVKVDFENGNVSLTAPQGIVPPASFQSHMNQNIYTSPNQSTPFQAHYQNSNSYLPQPQSFHAQQFHLNSPPANPAPFVKPSKSPQNQIPLHNNNPQSKNSGNHFLPTNPNNIEMISSQYHENQLSSNPATVRSANQSYNHEHVSNISSAMLNLSHEQVECIICQRSFSAAEFDQHLEFHKNRSNSNKAPSLSNAQQHLSVHQKNPGSNSNNTQNMLTQNSFNGSNDSSYMSASEQSSVNHSYHSEQPNSYQSQTQSQSENPLKKISLSNSKSQPQKQQEQSNSYEEQIKYNQMSRNPPDLYQSNHPSVTTPPSLGVIRNPIQVINSAQQTSNHSHSYENSLSYSSNPSQGQVRVMMDSHGQLVVAPQQQASYSSHSHSSSLIPQELIANPYINNLSIGSSGHGHHQQYHQGSSFVTANLGGTSDPRHNVIGPSFYQNSHSHSQNSSNRLADNSISNSNHSSQSNRHLNNQSAGSVPSGQSEGRNIYTGQMKRQPDNCSPLYEPIQPYPHHQQFRQIESKYVKQQISTSNPMLHLHQQQSPSNHNILMDESLSSISSRMDQSSHQGDFSNDFSGLEMFNPSKNNPNDHSYNSADASLFAQNSHSKQRNSNNGSKVQVIHKSKKNSSKVENDYSHTSDQKAMTSGDFYKKKSKHRPTPGNQDYLANSASSYYDRKFKEFKQQPSSSDEEEGRNAGSSQRLSYAQRLKEKKRIDEHPSTVLHNQSLRETKKSKKSSSKINGSRYSETDSLSKTKIPVNYLARQEFIEEVVSSKSTHKSTQPS